MHTTKVTGLVCTWITCSWCGPASKESTFLYVNCCSPLSVCAYVACITGILQMQQLPASLESSKCNTEGHLHFWGKGDLKKIFKGSSVVVHGSRGKSVLQNTQHQSTWMPLEERVPGCVSIPAVCAGEKHCCIFLHGIPGPRWWAGGASSALWKVLAELRPLHKCQNVTEPAGKLLLIWR